MKTATLVVLVCAAALLAAPAVWSQGGGAGGRNEEMRTQFREVIKQIRVREMQALQADPELQQRVDELERQRQELFKAADPELGPLYEQHSALKEQMKAARGAGRRQGHGRGGQRRRGQGRGRRGGQEADEAAGEADVEE